MKRKMMVLAVMLLTCTLATPVLAGKGSRNSIRHQYSGGSNPNFGAVTQSQARQQNQHRYQTKQFTESSASKIRSQLRTRDPLSHTSETLVGTDNSTPPEE